MLGPLGPGKGRQCQIPSKDLVPSTWLRTLSSIAASCSTNKVSWRVKLCNGCREVSFEFSEFSEAAASSFHTCTLDSGLLSGLLGGVFIAPGSGLLAPAVLWSSQLEGFCPFCAAAPRAKGTAPDAGFPDGLEQEGGLLSPATINRLNHKSFPPRHKYPDRDCTVG